MIFTRWIRGKCKQKRLLILLCAFCSSFILFNYAILSSSSASKVAPRQSQEIFYDVKPKEISESTSNRNTELSKLEDKQLAGFNSNYTDSNPTVSNEQSQLQPVEVMEGSFKLTTYNTSMQSSSVIFIITDNLDRDNSKVNLERSNGSIGKTESNQSVWTNSSSNITSSIQPHSLNSTSPEAETVILNLPQRLSSTAVDNTVAPSSLLITENTKKASHDQSTTSYSPSAPNSFLFHIPSCPPQTPLHRVQKRKKNLTVIENFIMGWRRVKCNETITYTTQADYRYLDNLVPLVERWDAPVSVAVYAPGSDLLKTLALISYAKLCHSKIDEWVTFHLIYDVKYSLKPSQNYTKPGDLFWLDKLYFFEKWRYCSNKPNFNKSEKTFRNENNMLYPVNILRNVARSAATTYFVLASDIELYPSINLVPSFMKMLENLKQEWHEEEERHRSSLKFKMTTMRGSLMATLFPSTIIKMEEKDNTSPNYPINESQSRNHSKIKNRFVFVPPIFEVEKDILPCQVETKEQLITLLEMKKAVRFHEKGCAACQKFPKYEEWRQRPNNEVKSADTIKLPECSNNTARSTSQGSIIPMKIFNVVKRRSIWEPIFIGTKEDPIYDERLSYEGLRDKMVSSYAMCLLDYNFYILDNAFLLHKPGIKLGGHAYHKAKKNQDKLIDSKIRSELLRKYGQNNECVL